MNNVENLKDLIIYQSQNNENIFKTGELEENRTTQKIRVVQNEGKEYVPFYVNYYSKDLKKYK